MFFTIDKKRPENGEKPCGMPGRLPAAATGRGLTSMRFVIKVDNATPRPYHAGGS
jgi:hypothetical protein